MIFADHLQSNKGTFAVLIVFYKQEVIYKLGTINFSNSLDLKWEFKYSAEEFVFEIHNVVYPLQN